MLVVRNLICSNNNNCGQVATTCLVDECLGSINRSLLLLPRRQLQNVRMMMSREHPVLYFEAAELVYVELSNIITIIGSAVQILFE